MQQFLLTPISKYVLSQAAVFAAKATNISEYSKQQAKNYPEGYHSTAIGHCNRLSASVPSSVGIRRHLLPKGEGF